MFLFPNHKMLTTVNAPVSQPPLSPHPSMPNLWQSNFIISPIFHLPHPLLPPPKKKKKNQKQRKIVVGNKTLVEVSKIQNNRICYKNNYYKKRDSEMAKISNVDFCWAGVTQVSINLESICLPGLDCNGQ